MNMALRMRYIEEALKIDYENFQPCLKTIRNILGWTCEEFGNRLGVTRQSISGWENEKVPLTKISWLAIKYVLEKELEEIRK